MLAAPQYGFVFLAMPKCASTAVESNFHAYAQVQLRGDRFKHLPYSGFLRHVQPLLRARGFPREAYEVVCLFREPIDWLFSWYRYRSRTELANSAHPQHRNYTGSMSFADFARAYMQGQQPVVGIGSQSRFVRKPDGRIGVDRIYRLEALDDLIEHLAAKIGRRVRIERMNVSPERTFELDDATLAELRAHLAPAYEIYERCTLPTPST